MPQTLVNIGGISGKADADKLVGAGEALNGVKLVNVNFEDGRVVITHEAGFDVEAFKKAATDLGFSA
ncbi:heavy-metal-associated domain-containing protein [Paralysiella testudinis]|uniref:Heavy-metal-associated domain-containing protein n=1 Tax=Paralysiella testudinis TaxID=2809020 RepID=A0A892ZHK0_9NEIS|nr:heavy metal-associated domain-containing protein [Paralysiella testudinis]QRQ82412.1 heavy-metal-associated domain-containing protein [Paralysiella testudinis]